VGTKSTRRRRIKIVSVLLVVPALLLSLGAGSAYATGVSVSLGGTAQLTNRIIITATVTVVCDPLPGQVLLADGVNVQIAQANGRTISRGTGSNGQTLTCDGVTVNPVTVTVTPDSGSGPFHGGNASAIAFAFHETGDSCGPGCVFNIQEEFADTGWVTVALRG
jgi:hypothetical protein